MNVSLPVNAPATSPSTFCSSSTVTPLSSLRRLGTCDPVTLRRRAEMSLCAMDPVGASSDLTLLPEEQIILGCGGLGLDFLAEVAAFPQPDAKIRSLSSKIQGGGNAGNALTAAARLGLKPRLISKLANDSTGKNLLAELEADGVDTTHIVVSEVGNSPFTYVIVDRQTNTRTCIHTPGHPAMVPNDLSQSRLFSALDGARIFYSDVRLPETALVIAKEAVKLRIPILVDVERKREGLNELLNMADYVVCSENFPQAWTEAPSIPSALISILVKLSHIKFVIVTFGEKGCIMLERNMTKNLESEEVDVDTLLESLKQKIDFGKAIPTCIASKPLLQLSANGIGSVCGRLLVGTSEIIPPSELIDTTGAGDAFIGAVLYAICADMPPEKMLPFAARVAAANCKSLGARAGLPRIKDPCLAPFLN